MNYREEVSKLWAEINKDFCPKEYAELPFEDKLDDRICQIKNDITFFHIVPKEVSKDREQAIAYTDEFTNRYIEQVVYPYVKSIKKFLEENENCKILSVAHTADLLSYPSFLTKMF